MDSKGELLVVETRQIGALSDSIDAGWVTLISERDISGIDMLGDPLSNLGLCYFFLHQIPCAPLLLGQCRMLGACVVVSTLH